jgi:hypothetical protein
MLSGGWYGLRCADRCQVVGGAEVVRSVTRFFNASVMWGQEKENVFGVCQDSQILPIEIQALPFCFSFAVVAANVTLLSAYVASSIPFANTDSLSRSQISFLSLPIKKTREVICS